MLLGRFKGIIVDRGDISLGLQVGEVLTAHGFSFSLMTDEDGWTRFRILLK